MDLLRENELIFGRLLPIEEPPQGSSFSPFTGRRCPKGG